MVGIDTEIDKYYSLRPAEYGFLESLTLQQSVQPEMWHGLDLTIRLSSISSSGSLCLEFKGVKDLRIGLIQGLVQYRLDIRSIRDDQQEGLHYRVVESEHDLLSFVSSNFAARICAD